MTAPYKCLYSQPVTNPCRRSGTGEEQAPFLSSGASSAASRTLPRPAPFPNGKPPSYSAAVQLMDLADREPRPRYLLAAVTS